MFSTDAPSDSAATPQAAPQRAAAATPATKKPVRLVDEWSKGYIVYNGREPRTLEELAIARVDYEHRRRRAEIKAMARKLALLDEHLQALADRGIDFSRRDITTHDHGKTLRITPGLFTSKPDDELYAALIALGFREVERKDMRGCDWVTLKHGRALLVLIDVTSRKAAAA